MDGCEAFTLATGKAYYYSQRSPDKDTSNEDSALLVSLDANRSILAVADGMGGRPLGAKASRQVVDGLLSAVRRVDPESAQASLRPAILDALEDANRELVSKGVGAATTVAVAEINQGYFRPYHVGDSTVLVVGQRGKVKAQTVAHSPVGYAVEAGLLDEKQAMHHEHRHLVSNIVGANDMRIEMGSRLKLASRDTVLLASDGLVDNLHSHEIIDMIRVGSLERAAERLVTMANARMRSPQVGEPSKLDDLTFILYRSNS